jgi:hypothetical protein
VRQIPEPPGWQVRELVESAVAMDADTSIGAIIVTGAGSKAFAAGAGELVGVQGGWVHPCKGDGSPGRVVPGRPICHLPHTHSSCRARPTPRPPLLFLDIKEMSNLGYMDMFKRKLFGELDTLGTVRGVPCASKCGASCL